MSGRIEFVLKDGIYYREWRRYELWRQAVHEDHIMIALPIELKPEVPVVTASSTKSRMLDSLDGILSMHFKPTTYTDGLAVYVISIVGSKKGNSFADIFRCPNSSHRYRCDDFPNYLFF